MVGFYSQFPDLPDAIEIAGKTYELDKDSWPSYSNADEDDISSACGWTMWALRPGWPKY